MNINEKIRLIRTTEGFTQVEFAKLIGVSCDVGVREIESGKRKEVGSAKIERICNRFPEYALWLTTGQTSGDQIDPYIKQSQSTKTG